MIDLNQVDYRKKIKKARKERDEALIENAILKEKLADLEEENSILAEKLDGKLKKRG